MIFGTDGVRGIVDKDINCKLAYNVGRAFAIYLNKKKLNNYVVVGKDTRTSGDAISFSIISGLVDYGINVFYLDIVATPVISFLVSKLNVGGGVMITASHNNYKYNGIKLFSNIGEKLNKTSENEIENIIINSKIKPSKQKGKVLFNKNLTNIYLDNLINVCKCDLSNLNIVIDSANGSNYILAPQIYKHLGANVIEVDCNNDGTKINKNCGANHIENVKKQVLEHKADFGISFDGDGDRLRVILNDGSELDGDDLLYVFAMLLKNKNKLNSLTVVGTVMTNLGLENTLLKNNIQLLRTDVGDKNVISLMKQNHLSLGGEPSGHICLYEHNCTCDALFNSLYLIKGIVDKSINIKELLLSLKKFNSVTKNVEVSYDFRKNFNNNILLQNQIKNLQHSNEDVRIVVRPSGTEPVIRIYVEGESEIKINKIIENILDFIN